MQTIKEISADHVVTQDHSTKAISQAASNTHAMMLTLKQEIESLIQMMDSLNGLKKTLLTALNTVDCNRLVVDETKAVRDKRICSENVEDSCSSALNQVSYNF